MWNFTWIRACTSVCICLEGVSRQAVKYWMDVQIDDGAWFGVKTWLPVRLFSFFDNCPGGRGGSYRNLSRDDSWRFLCFPLAACLPVRCFATFNAYLGTFWGCALLFFRGGPPFILYLALQLLVMWQAISSQVLMLGIFINSVRNHWGKALHIITAIEVAWTIRLYSSCDAVPNANKAIQVDLSYSHRNLPYADWASVFPGSVLQATAGKAASRIIRQLQCPFILKPEVRLCSKALSYRLILVCP